MLPVSGMALDLLQRLPFRWSLVPPARDARRTTLLLATGMGVSRSSPHPEACRGLLTYLVSPPLRRFYELDSFCLHARQASALLRLDPVGEVREERQRQLRRQLGPDLRQVPIEVAPGPVGEPAGFTSARM